MPTAEEKKESYSCQAEEPIAEELSTKEIVINFI